MAKQDYSGKLKDPRWQKRRLKTFERDNWCCQACGDAKTTLNVHHIKYGNEPWDVPDDYLITLCEHCHSIIEELRNKIGKEDDFKKIKIIKSKPCNGMGGERAMYVSLKGSISMVIYDSSGAVKSKDCLDEKEMKEFRGLIAHALKNAPEIKF